MEHRLLLATKYIKHAGTVDFNLLFWCAGTFYIQALACIVRMRLSYKIILGTLTVVIVILGVIWISPIGQFIRSADFEENKLEFDKKLWTLNWDKGRNDENDRHFMLTDLTENHLKIGMDSVEVKNLLGEPERDFGFSYNLGIYRSGFDPTFLILEFDENGKLKEVQIETI